MINFDALTLNIFAHENKNFLTGARVQKIQQPNRSELIFTLRNNGETRKFYININPNFYHVCFMSKENEQKRDISIPKAAPMFCMLLRKYIQNLKIENISVPHGERILEFYFDFYDELNEKSKLCLAIELMGKYSNVILYNYDTNVIIGCNHNVSSEKSRERELAGLMPYIYPPKQKKKNLLKISLESFLKNIDPDNIVKSISSSYYYLTIAVVDEIYNRLSDFSIENLYFKLREYLSKNEYEYYISNDFSKYFLFEFPNSFRCENINELIDNYFSHHQNEVLKENFKLKIKKVIENKLKKLYILKEKQQEQIKKLDKANDYKNKADILMTNIYNLKNLNDEVKLFDFLGNEILITVDKNMTVSENANKYYSLYKKIKAAFEHAQTMIKETDIQIMYYEEQKFYIENSSDIEDIKDIYNEIFEEIPIVKERETKVLLLEYKGFRIFVGRNKKQNDYILSKISSSEDLWFHPLNAPGAHILIKINGKASVPDDVLLKAAELTKEYSSQKNNSKTSIIYTKRKYVKKANNKLAFVTYKNESEIIV